MSDIDISRDGAVLIMAFNRPAKKNAITAAMYQTMADALKHANEDPGVRVVLLRGTADIFTAGNDLEDFMKNPPLGPDSPVFQFLYNVAHAKKPLVAAVNGAAVGIGTTMLLHCDAVYAADNARFSMPFTTLGLCPEAASSLLLPAIAGYQRAAEKLLFGEPFGAAEAKEMGFVTQVLPAAEVAAHALARAQKLGALPATSIRATKALMRSAHIKAIEMQMTDESALFRKMLASPEAKEAFSAFFEKRKPDFSRFT